MVLTQTAGASLELAKKDAEELVARWEAAINNRGSTAAAAQNVADLFTRDAVINISGNVQIGRAAIEKFYAEQIEENNPRDFRTTIVEVKASGNIAWAYGSANRNAERQTERSFLGHCLRVQRWALQGQDVDGRFQAPAPSAGCCMQITALLKVAV